MYKKKKKLFVLVHVMNLLNLHLRISCIVLFAFFLGSGCLNYDNNWCPSNHFTWKSACCLQMMCFCIHHHYFFLMMVINIKDKQKSHMAETWITGSNQCIKFQTMVPCGEYSYTISHPHCAFDVTSKILHFHKYVKNCILVSVLFGFRSRPKWMHTTQTFYWLDSDVTPI